MAKYTSNSGIYVILNTRNGKIYLGQAQNFESRWKNHRHKLNAGKHRNKHLQQAWNKYGEKAFKFQKLEYCSIEQLDEREQHYLNIYMDRGICYNMANDAHAPMRGKKHTPEARLKMSKALKGRVKSPEECQKISAALKGRKATEESRRNQSEAQTGRKHSDETKRKIGDAHKGKIISEKERQRLSDMNKGKTMSEEARKKISAAGKGRKDSDETREKRRIAATNPSPETRRKRSESQMGEKNHRFGKKNSPETRQKISESHRKRRIQKELEAENTD